MLIILNILIILGMIGNFFDAIYLKDEDARRKSIYLLVDYICMLMVVNK